MLLIYWVTTNDAVNTNIPITDNNNRDDKLSEKAAGCGSR